MRIPELPLDVSEAGSTGRVSRSDSPSTSSLARRNRTFVALLDQAVVSGTNFLVAVAVGRYCGIEELGFYTLGFSLLILALSVHEGLILTPYVVLRGGCERKDHRVLAGNALAMSVCFAAAVMVSLGAIGLLGGWLGNSDALRKVVFTVCIATPFTLWRDFARRMELAELRVRSAVIVDSIAALIQLGCIATLMAIGKLNAMGALFAMGVGSGSTAIVWFVLTRNRFKIRTSSLRQGVLRSGRLGVWITATRLATVAGNQTVPWILAFCLGVTATGGFAAANSLVSISNPILMGLGSIHLPEAVSDYSKGGIAALNRSTVRITRIMGTTAVVFSLVAILAAAPILKFAYGTGFDQFALVAVILSVASFVSVLGFGAETGLRILERPRFDFFASLVMLVATSVITFLLAQQWGAVGGAIGLLCGATAATAIRRVAFANLSRTTAQVGSQQLETSS